MNIIKRIWNDPVVSKIIATIIISLIPTPFIQEWSWLVILLLLFVSLPISLFLNKIKPYLYDDKAKAHDEELIKQIKVEILPYEKTVYCIKASNSSFDGYFNITPWFHYFSKFKEQCKNPTFSFINPKLERIKKNLLEAIANFIETEGRYAHSSLNPNHSTDMFILKPTAEDNPKKHYEIVSEVNAAADRVCKEYESLIHTSKKILRV
jgi:hypothetical protein